MLAIYLHFTDFRLIVGKVLSMEIILLDIVDQFWGLTNEMQPHRFSGVGSFINTLWQFCFLKKN